MKTFPVRVLIPMLALVFLVPGAARAVDIEVVESPGGITAWLVQDHSNPIISLSFSMKGGALLDPQGKEGTAYLTAGLLDEGAGDMDSEALHRRMEELAVHIGLDSSGERFSGSLQTLTRNRDAAFDLLRLMLTEPRFDTDAVERVRGQALAIQDRNESDPNYIAGRNWYDRAFEEHPYGRPSKGTKESLQAITIEDMQSFVREGLTRDSLKIGVVGDITPEALAPLLDSTFGKLPETGRTVELPPATPGGGGEVLVFEEPVPQSAILFGQPGLKRNDPDFYPAYLVNHIVGGGGFTSRLTDEIREKRGLTYGIGSYMHTLDAGGILMGSVSTRNASAAETLEVLKAEWADVRETGITAEELDAAKRFLTGSFPLRFDRSPAIASMLVAIQEDNLGIDFLDRRNELVESVTLEEANRVARALYDPAKLFIVIAGQPEGIRPQTAD